VSEQEIFYPNPHVISTWEITPRNW